MAIEAASARAKDVGRTTTKNIVRIGTTGALGAADATWTAKGQVTTLSICNKTNTTRWISIFVQKNADDSDRTHILSEFPVQGHDIAVITMSLHLVDTEYLRAIAEADDSFDVTASGFQKLR